MLIDVEAAALAFNRKLLAMSHKLQSQKDDPRAFELTEARYLGMLSAVYALAETLENDVAVAFTALCMRNVK